MTDSPSTTTDALCRECQHMRVYDDGSRWCHSPQIHAAQNGRGTRAIFERDSFPETGRDHKAGTGKCGPLHLNFKRREAI
jgi:hypothetical protein